MTTAHLLRAMWEHATCFDAAIRVHTLREPRSLQRRSALNNSVFPTHKENQQGLPHTCLHNYTHIIQLAQRRFPNKQLERKVSIAAKAISQRHFAVRRDEQTDPLQLDPVVDVMTPN